MTQPFFPDDLSSLFDNAALEFDNFSDPNPIPNNSYPFVSHDNYGSTSNHLDGYTHQSYPGTNLSNLSNSQPIPTATTTSEPVQSSQANESRPKWIAIRVNDPPGRSDTVFAMCPHPSCIESLYQETRPSASDEEGNNQPRRLPQKTITRRCAFTSIESAKNAPRFGHERRTHEFETSDKIDEKKGISWPFIAFESIDQIEVHIKKYGNKTLDESMVNHPALVGKIHDAFHSKAAEIHYDQEQRPNYHSKLQGHATSPGVERNPLASSSASQHASANAVVSESGGKKRRVEEAPEREFSSSLRMYADDTCFDIPAERFDIDALTRYWNPNFVVKRRNLSAMRFYNKPQRHFEDHLGLRPWYWIKSTDVDNLCDTHYAPDTDDKASVVAWLEEHHDDAAQDPFWGPMVIPGETTSRHRGHSSASSPRSSPTALSTRKAGKQPVPRVFPVGHIEKNAPRRKTPSTVSGPTIEQIWKNANDVSFHDFKIYDPQQRMSTSNFEPGTHVAVHRSAIQFHEQLVCDFRLKDSGYYTVSIFIKMPQYYVASQADPMPSNRRLWTCNNPDLLRKWGYNSGLDTKSLQYASDCTDVNQKTKRIVEAPIRDWLGIQVLVGPPVAKESCNPQAGNIDKYRLELSRSLVSEERRIAYTLDKFDMERAMKKGLAEEWCEVSLSTKRLQVPVGNATQRIVIFYGCDAIHGGYAVDRGPLIFGGARLTLVQPDRDYAGHGPLETAQEVKPRDK